MSGLTLAAPAKLNLRLEVGPPGPDGMHPVRTLLVALDGLADQVTVRPAAIRSVDCGPFSGPGNLAWRALDALERSVGRALPLAVRIDKAIPVQAGLGGGSSDAAATLVAADRLLGLGLGAAALERVAADVGADVPFFVRAGARWAGGRGEALDAAQARVPGFAAVVLAPAFGLPTPAVYRAFDGLGPPAPACGAPVPDDFPRLAGWARNDLWPAALALAPRLGAAARALHAAGARAVVLCGSGSALAGLTPDAASAARVAGAVPAALGGRWVVGPAPERAAP